MNIEQTHRQVTTPFKLTTKARRGYLVLKLLADDSGEVSPIHQAQLPNGTHAFLPSKGCIVEVADNIRIWAPIVMIDVPSKFIVRIVGLLSESDSTEKKEKHKKCT